MERVGPEQKSAVGPRGQNGEDVKGRGQYLFTGKIKGNGIWFRSGSERQGWSRRSSGSSPVSLGRRWRH